MRLPTILTLIFAAFLAAGPAAAQSAGDLPSLDAVRQALPVAPPPGAIDLQEVNPTNQKLADILARQRGDTDDRLPRAGLLDDLDDGTATGAGGALLRQAGPGDAEIWEALRFGQGNIISTTFNPGSRVVMQERGMWWLQFREGPLRTWGGILLLATLGLLAVFYAIRGRITIDAGRSGRTILRFSDVERFAHWLLAVSFILLALTGLALLFGRNGLIPFMGLDAYATLAAGSKWVHNNVSWAFMLALILVFVFWVWHNIPDRTDLNWFKQGGGLFTKGHPPAKKFNAGQKLIFWAVILLGGSISVTGLSLLFPFELPMFAKTFGVMNGLGIEVFSAQMAPHEEMQYAQLWHAIVSFVLMAIIIAHIYLGSVGMEGAFDAMGKGEVDLNWAREHHSLWVEEKLGGRAADARDAPSGGRATPAE
jgi:formate dehydrogenase subunit gamma